MNEGIRLRWEKATALGVRYYEVDLGRDLWGEWRLARAWGRRGTRLGQVRVVPCDSRNEGLARGSRPFWSGGNNAGIASWPATIPSGRFYQPCGGKDRRRSRTANPARPRPRSGQAMAKMTACLTKNKQLYLKINIGIIPRNRVM